MELARPTGYCALCWERGQRRGARGACADCQQPVCSGKECSKPHKRKKRGPGYSLSGTYRLCLPCEAKPR